MAPKDNPYPPVAWNAEDKRLVKEIFTILEENSTIRKGIWPRRGENSGGKSKISHFKILAKKLFQNESQIKDFLKDEKAVTHYGNAVKNRVARLEKGWKKAKVALTVTGAGLPHEDDIHEGSYIMDKWHEVRVVCPWFYRMKNLVDDRFDDIGAAITNSGEDIDIDVMNTNRKTSKSIPSTPSCPPPVSQEGENYNVPDDENEEDIEWEKTDNEDDLEENINPAEPPLRNISQPTARSITPSSTGQITPNIGSIISRRKPGVLGDLTDGLKDIGMAKSKRKERHDAAIEETRRMEIRVKAEVEKKRLDIERELGARRLALEERQQAFREKMALEGRQWGAASEELPDFHHDDQSVN